VNKESLSHAQFGFNTVSQSDSFDKEVKTLSRFIFLYVCFDIKLLVTENVCFRGQVKRSQKVSSDSHLINISLKCNEIKKIIYLNCYVCLFPAMLQCVSDMLVRNESSSMISHWQIAVLLFSRRGQSPDFGEMQV